MLQIISGKFFTSEDKYIHDGKGILYSNCNLFSKIETNIGILEPLDYSGDITSFIFSYKNQIEKDGILVRCGDDEILEQFKLICSFGLNSYFSEHREQVAKICSPIKSKNTQGHSPSLFLNNKVSLKKQLEPIQIEKFIRLTNKIISLERKSYKNVMNSLRIFSDAVETVSYNIDLAYSMLVYCIESLSQNINHSKSNWNDSDINNKSKLEEAFKEISQDTSNKIKNILLEDKNFKIQKRYISFIQKYLSDSFFINEADGIEIPLRKGQLEKALNNTYQIRSKFTHSLQPIQNQIKTSHIGINDVFTFAENPYLTFSGLFRLAENVINNYILSLNSVKKEAFDYRQDLPGLITMEMAPQYWIGNHESFSWKNTNKRLGAFLGQLESGEPVTELTKVMNKIKKIFNQTPEFQRAPMLYLFYTYNLVLRKDLRIDGWENFISKHKQYFNEVRFENIAIQVVTRYETPWTVHKCIKEYKKYSKNRHKNGHLSLTRLTEAAILCSIANKAQEAGYSNEYNWLINTAISETSGSKDIQVYLYNQMLWFKKISIQKLLAWNRKNINGDTGNIT